MAGTFSAVGFGVLVTDEVDAGVVVLAACLKLRGRAITIDELKRLAGGPPTLSPSDMVVAAGKAGFKAKIRKTSLEAVAIAHAADRHDQGGGLFAGRTDRRREDGGARSTCSRRDGIVH